MERFGLSARMVHGTAVGARTPSRQLFRHHIGVSCFATVHLALAAPFASAGGGTGDFDGDARDELLLRNGRTGEWQSWTLADRPSEGQSLPLPTANVYRFMGIGDFDCDSRDDVLLRRRDDRSWLYYAVQAPDASPRVVVVDGHGTTSDPEFELRGIGDLDGDGCDDLVLRNDTTGEWIAYLMDGARSEPRLGLGATRDLEYVFADLGDFNGDARDDLLLRHRETGVWIAYEMGTSARGVQQYVALSRNPAFALEGVGDLNGDGRDDILLRHRVTGEWIHYEMDGSRAVLNQHSAIRSDAAERFAAIGDFNGDGTSSVVLRDVHGGGWIEYSVADGARGALPGLVIDLAWRVADPKTPSSDGGLWSTEDGRIVMELEPRDWTAENRFDLDGQTLVFTPDTEGGYLREVRELAWEDDLGNPVSSHARIELPFGFDFAGERWDAVRVYRQGLLAFGDKYTDPYWNRGDRFNTMEAYASSFRSANVVAPLYKPILSGFGTDSPLQVAVGVDRVVVTWSVTEDWFHVYGVAPETPARFQAVLHADGRIAFNYRDVPFGDGIVGLFPDDSLARGDLLLSVLDPTDASLPGHLDLTEVTIHENDNRGVILEFTTRDPIPEPSDGEAYHYSLYFDFDEPYWEPGGFWQDIDFQWTIDLRGTGGHSARNGTILPRQEGNRLAMLGDLANVDVRFASVVADAMEWDDGVFIGTDRLASSFVQLPDSLSGPTPDLSTPAAEIAGEQSEVFHYRRLARSTEELMARLVHRLGDEFDFIVFHSEFRFDVQEHGSPMYRYGVNVGVRGIGGDLGNARPIETSRLKGGWVRPVWMQSRMLSDFSLQEGRHFDTGLVHFAHEFTHLWTARASYDRNGNREPMEDGGGHWRWELHLPAAFPWRADAENTARTSMGGAFWHENDNGTFTLEWDVGNTLAGGPSWLDLYAMGLADASEVPDMFILRDLEPVDGANNTYTATKEVVTIDRIVAAEGPREPSASAAQRTFNVGFVYLLEPGSTADPDMLALHRVFRDKVIEYWARITGERSWITTFAPSVSGPSARSTRDAGKVRLGFDSS